MRSCVRNQRSCLVDAKEIFVLFERSLPMLSGSGREILKLNATSTLALSPQPVSRMKAGGP